MSDTSLEDARRILAELLAQEVCPYERGHLLATIEFLDKRIKAKKLQQ